EQLAGILFQLNAVTPTAGPFKTWDYTHIRKINTAIARVSESTTLTQEFKDGILGQAYFLRAYTYFEMLRLYGGIPYITVPQDARSEEHTSELQSRENLVCRLLLEKKNRSRV